MKEMENNLYNFVYRGLLAEEALDNAGRKSRLLAEWDKDRISRTLSIELFDDEMVTNAKKMSVVYTAISAFENSLRNLISKTLLESNDENWWNVKVSKKVREAAERKMEDEKNTRWHTQRGIDPINYITLGQLHSIIQNNWEQFEPFIHNLEWAKSIFDAVERSRNVIMHSGMLDEKDIERLGIYIRDWIKQVGA